MRAVTFLGCLVAVLPLAAGFASTTPIALRPGAPPLGAPAVTAATPSVIAPAAAAVNDLFASALRWGMSHCAVDADDVMLAMVSPHAYWLLRDWRRRTFGDLQTSRHALEGVRQAILKAGASEDVLRGASVTVRTKGLWSTFHKAAVRQQQVHDVLAVRVVLRKGFGAEDCFSANEAVHAMWASQPGRHKDYITNPKPNGYRALHETMVLPSGTAFEMQIRSHAMHREAEFGAAAHRRYKGALLKLPMAVMSGVALAPEARDPMRSWSDLLGTAYA